MLKIFSERKAKLKSNIKLYDFDYPNNFVIEYQLNKFNSVWRKAYSEIPFYNKLKIDNNLPNFVSSLDEISNFPVVDKNLLKSHEQVFRETPNAERYTLTGGSSGVTTEFPMNRYDADTAWVNTFTGRSWNNINPFDRCLMIWGHSHLFANKHQFSKLIRNAKDKILNINRQSAYDMSQKNIQNIIKVISDYKPKYIIGYGSCLCEVAKEFVNLQVKAPLQLHTVINTSEPINQANASLIASAFNCKVVNEYGMAEAGVIGYSISTITPIKVFWRDYLVQRRDNKLFVTTLGERCFPLINYDPEDVSFGPKSESLSSIEFVEGKARSILKLIDRSGTIISISVVLLDHILKQHSFFTSVAYQWNDVNSITILYTGDTLSDDAFVKGDLIEKLKLENMEFCRSQFNFVRVPVLPKTISGKLKKVNFG